VSPLLGLLADLHLHTVASACAEIEMLPPLIVERALQLGLDVIAITDHNSVANVRAVQEAAEGTGLTVWPGMEVQTREEAHIVCLFDRPEQAEALEQCIEEHLPPGENPEEFFGVQLVVDAGGGFLRKDARLRQVACGLPVERVVALVRELGGIAIGAHVDRPSYSLLASLGFIPEGLDLAALEVSQAVPLDQIPSKMAHIARWPLIRSSDAHTLSRMCACLRLVVAEPTIDEFEMALRNEARRAIELLA